VRTRVLGRAAPGTALVEFALTTLVFFGMIFAIGDFAVWLHAQNAATGAAQLAPKKKEHDILRPGSPRPA